MVGEGAAHPEPAAVDEVLHLEHTAHDRERKRPHLRQSLATRAGFRSGRAIRRHLHRLQPRKQIA